MVVLGLWFASSSGRAARRSSTREGGGVAFFAHIGGFVFGMLVAKVFASDARWNLGIR